MKKLNLFQCEYCGTQYSEKEDALACEKSHIKPQTIARACFNPYKVYPNRDKNYPEKIYIKFEDGGEIRYKRG